jgi:hypothetical protein
VKFTLACKRRWDCSDANKRNAEVGGVSDAADTVFVTEIARSVDKIRGKSGRYKRHVGEERLDVRDAGGLFHVQAVPAQPRVFDQEFHRFE